MISTWIRSVSLWVSKIWLGNRKGKRYFGTVRTFRFFECWGVNKCIENEREIWMEVELEKDRKISKKMWLRSLAQNLHVELCATENHPSAKFWNTTHIFKISVQCVSFWEHSVSLAHLRMGYSFAFFKLLNSVIHLLIILECIELV